MLNQRRLVSLPLLVLLQHLCRPLQLAGGGSDRVEDSRVLPRAPRQPSHPLLLCTSCCPAHNHHDEAGDDSLGEGEEQELGPEEETLEEGGGGARGLAAPHCYAHRHAGEAEQVPQGEPSKSASRVEGGGGEGEAEEGEDGRREASVRHLCVHVDGSSEALDDGNPQDGEDGKEESTGLAHKHELMGGGGRTGTKVDVHGEEGGGGVEGGGEGRHHGGEDGSEDEASETCGDELVDKEGERSVRVAAGGGGRGRVALKLLREQEASSHAGQQEQEGRQQFQPSRHHAPSLRMLHILRCQPSLNHVLVAAVVPADEERRPQQQAQQRVRRVAVGAEEMKVSLVLSA
mmetsp:Transcript_9994/g.33326  ORF Transcript_9994/g.33326 Transcript_9994/m.33326 type:complete len:345 (+) Transcript_9994:75-1109(+)